VKLCRINLRGPVFFETHCTFTLLFVKILIHKGPPYAKIFQKVFRGRVLFWLSQ